ncbi:MAG: tauA, partial [Rhodoferax sp.]|nr:tauA [Rhodoferax sp.]
MQTASPRANTHTRTHTRLNTHARAVPTPPGPHPRRWLIRLATTIAIAASACTLASAARAEDKVTFLTSWYAQAEHGGFYQAVADGTYKKHGLDVSIKMGGPQV